MAARPRTLPAAMVPVMVGSALAYSEGLFRPAVSIVALLCSFLIQIGTNFVNDLYDHLKGADTKKRVGPTRVLNAGLVTVPQMYIAIACAFGLSFLLGLYLVSIGGWIILLVGIISIIAGIAYTAGPYPLAYNGLGDVFVFLFFGLVGTVFTYYCHTLHLSIEAISASIPVGALITAILVVNNYRDIEQDRVANKNTLAVIFGKRFSEYQYYFLFLISYLTPVFFFATARGNAIVLLPAVSAPVAFNLARQLTKRTGPELNPLLGKTAMLSALFGILFSIGLLYR